MLQLADTAVKPFFPSGMWRGHPWAWGGQRGRESTDGPGWEREGTDTEGNISMWMRSKTLNMLSALNLGDTNPRGRRDKIVRGGHKVIKAESVFTSHSVAYLVIKSYFSEVVNEILALKC